MSLIVCTPGGASDNCYTTLAQADAYFANTLRSATWVAFDETQREQALIQATAEVEAAGGPLVNTTSPARAYFPGTPYDQDSTPQALHFPTTADFLADGTTKVIPGVVKAAVCEQAYALLANQASQAGQLVDHGAMQAAGVQSFSMDGLSVNYGGKRTGGCPDGMAQKAWEFLKPLVRKTFGTTVGGGGARHVHRHY